MTVYKTHNAGAVQKSKRAGNLHKCRRIILRMAAILAILAMSMPVSALSESFFAASSRLASGKWVKVKVKDSGMYLIPNAELKRLGFSQPDKVRVYGFGGRVLTSGLSESMPDDLPLAPCMITEQGIVFYGVDFIRWTASGRGSSLSYSHEQHPYGEESWYFLSDSGDPAAEIPSGDKFRSGPVTYDTFIERGLHETDLAFPHPSGRRAYGEDFRLTPSQTFKFQLPGKCSDEVKMQILFGATVSSGKSTLALTANGKSISDGRADVINGISNSTVFVVNSTIEKSAEIKDENLLVGINYSYTGVLSFARLDYIQVEYERTLALNNGELCFYGNYSNNDVVRISGCDASTVIWDVTNPHAPLRMDVSIENGKAYINPGEGYREFVAFNPASVSRRIVETRPVANQDIHGLDIPDMVIISPSEYIEASQRLASLREKEGLKVLVLDPAQIYNEFSSGTPDVSAFRRMLKMWYDRGGGLGKSPLRYCMIMSRPTYDNKMVTAAVKSAGYPRVPIWQSSAGTTESSSYSTDCYIGMLDDVSDDVFTVANGKMRVAVARIPVKSLSEADTFVDKIYAYTEKPDYGFWRNSVLLVADDGDQAAHFMQSQDVYEGMRSGDFGKGIAYERLYFDSYPLSYTGTGASYPECSARLLSRFKDGVGFINYIGHASPREWSHESVLTWTDIRALRNTRYPFLYAATCDFGCIDGDTECGAENMLLNPEGGIIGTIVPNRSVFINSNGTQSAAMAKIIFDRKPDGKPKTYGDIYMETLNSLNVDNRLRYCLMADPSMRLPGCDVVAEVTHINGIEVTDDSAGWPEIKARQNVEIAGRIINVDGSPAADYNGVLQLKLYDAESVIETYGNGDTGRAKVYNDRVTMLVSTTAKVVNGEWKTSATLPSEIVNNYSPAQILCYAYSEDGREANGGCESFYVYGSDSNVPEDIDGPEIRNFYLNTPDFTTGGSVNRNPVLFATLSDPSGIKLSNAGVGRRLSLTVDNEVYNDLDIYFTPDPEDGTTGTLVYPMAELIPGKHTLSLVAWDNADNSTVATLDFDVAAASSPTIFELGTDCNPAKTSVVFSVRVDRPMTRLDCTIEVFDLNGRLVWSSDSTPVTDISSRLSASWNLTDKAGHRVPRGIYLYRARVTTPEGTYNTATAKLAVTAP